MIIEQISSELASSLCRKITANLPEYFGLPEANESYISGVQTCINFAAKVDGRYVALLALNLPYPKSASIYWIGVLREAHGKGVGKALVLAAENVAHEKGVDFITVETVSLSEGDV